MLNSVSFGQRVDWNQKPNFDAPQAYTRPVNPGLIDAPKEKKGSNKVLKTIAGLALTAAAAIGLAAVGGKMGWFKPETIKKIIPDKLLNAEKLAKFKEPVKKGLEYVNKFGRDTAAWGIKKGRAVSQFVTGLFKKAPAAA